MTSPRKDDVRVTAEVILDADDKFRAILECPDFLQGAKKSDRAMKEVASVLNSDLLSVDELVSVELARLRIQRMRSNLNIAEAERIFDKISSLRDAATPQTIQYSLLKAELTLYVHGDCREAFAQYESLELQLRNTNQHFLYGLVLNGMAVVLGALGKRTAAEERFQDAMSIFRRLNNSIQYAYSLNNYGVLKKKCCQYLEAERTIKKALGLFKLLEIPEGQTFCYNNLGIIKIKTGDWAGARYCFDRINRREDVLLEGNSQRCDNRNLSVNLDSEINQIHLDVIQRRFKGVQGRFVDLLKSTAEIRNARNTTLLLEFYAEFKMAVSDLDEADQLIQQAKSTVRATAPTSDIMTEILRRQAQLHLLKNEPKTAKQTALECIRLCIKIKDKHEMGAALRILAEANLALGKTKKAISCYEASINTLKGIHECYELMRSCISYSEFLVSTKSSDADIYLLEARQLCRKLKIDFFTAQVLILYSKFDFNNGDMVSARDHLKRANECVDRLQPCDKKTVAPMVREWYKTLEKAILQTSQESAKRLKSLGKIYEEARFPLEELKPELATEVARNVGAETLFLAQQKNSGYRIPLKYNLSINEAKQILRRQIRCDAKTLFKGGDPRFCPMMNGKTLVSVPGQTGKGFILCAVVQDRKTFTPKDLEFLFASVEAMERVATEINEVSAQMDAEEFFEDDENRLAHPGGPFEEIITIDQELIKVIRLAERASQSSVPILLEGETGVGKELFADAIHANSSRKDGPFIAINAAGVPVNLLESQLFGHVKGAFTDAVSDRVGLVEEAKGGTLFFDEVGDMSEELQIKLLRLLENGEFRRLGENDIRKTNVRVVSATNKNLEDRIKNGLFREDLYYRLATVGFKIPPLRERRRDIEFLVRHFLTRGVEKLGFSRRRLNVDMKALEAFELYGWPGNVRELRNEIMRILSLIGDGEVIRFGMLSERIIEAFRSGNESGILTQRVERFERRLILKALEDNSWNRSKTAEHIGIPRTTLLFKMKTLNIV
jgi:DNA-binding NtrC family response regulator